MINDDSAGGDPDYFICRDHLYSPAAVIDSTGAITERYDYDVYGSPTIYTDNSSGGWYDGDESFSAGNMIGNFYLFTGRELDILDSGSLKIQYSRARYYCPATGRFISRDPIGYEDGMNLYEYVKSGPVNGLDPHGLFMPPDPTPWNPVDDTFGKPLPGIQCCKEYGLSIAEKLGESTWQCANRTVGMAWDPYGGTGGKVCLGAVCTGIAKKIPAVGVGFWIGYPTQFAAALAFCESRDCNDWGHYNACGKCE
jgi:RHS repeat-associated protein